MHAATAHVFWNGPVGKRRLVDLAESRHHMRRSKPADGNKQARWRVWAAGFGK